MTQSMEKHANLKQLARRRAAGQFAGRTVELQRLLSMLRTDGPLLLYVHGLGGAGKTTLMARFADEARARGATVFQLDCRLIEPTERGFLHALADAVDCPEESISAICRRLSENQGLAVFVLDSYEVFRFLDLWLRERFLPELGDNVRVILSGREPPVTAWLASPQWQGAFESMAVGSLDEASAVEMLTGAGMSEADARHINRYTHGHPLALQLAIATRAERPEVDLEGETIPQVLRSLVEFYMSQVDDAHTREALEAAACVRRVTVSLLRAMIPEAFARDMHGRLESLPFVTNSRDGLHLHDAVREALAAHLKAQDPERHQLLRRRAWAQLRREVATAGRDDLWRYTADLLYMIENPLIREGFFPTGSPLFSVQRARAEDGAPILDIVRRHEPPEVVDLMTSWWSRLPQSFYAVRDQDNEVVAFYQAFDPAQIANAWLKDDPLTAYWVQHLENNPVGSRETVMFMRRWLTRDEGEMPGPAQGACWLDIKRIYMQMRPHLRRIYLTVTEKGAQAYAPVVAELGFVRSGSVDIGRTYYTSINDFGPESVDGWLAGLIAAELGIKEAGLLDHESRELIVEGARVQLTRLEYAVMAYLDGRKGRAVSRASLLADRLGLPVRGRQQRRRGRGPDAAKEARTTCRRHRDRHRRWLPVARELKRCLPLRPIPGRASTPQDDEAYRRPSPLSD